MAENFERHPHQLAVKVINCRRDSRTGMYIPDSRLDINPSEAVIFRNSSTPRRVPYEVILSESKIEKENGELRWWAAYIPRVNALILSPASGETIFLTHDSRYSVRSNYISDPNGDIVWGAIGESEEAIERQFKYWSDLMPRIKQRVN